MRILFLSYWALQDPLTIATVFPHLQLLQARSDVESILLVTIERNGAQPSQEPESIPFNNGKIIYRPLASRSLGFVLFTKTDDFIRFPRQLISWTAECQITHLLARSSVAGALAYMVAHKTGLPFFVESFEPHAEYMLNGGVWKRYDPRYIMQVRWEKKQKKYAQGLMPVAENHRRQLITEGVPAERIITVPCSVDLQTFGFNAELREQYRREAGYMPANTVGVYVGKFGGIYYDNEAFELFRQAAQTFGRAFRLIILTPHPAAEILEKLAKIGLDASQAIVRRVPHTQVPAYLAAADFAFVLSRPAPCLSPIKVGEYWASGLPIFIAEQVGDDSEIVKRENAGAVYDVTRPITIAEGLIRINQQMQQPDHRTRIMALAHQYRSVERAHEAYQYFLH